MPDERDRKARERDVAPAARERRQPYATDSPTTPTTPRVGDRGWERSRKAARADREAAASERREAAADARDAVRRSGV
jgi:hypothetical protein